MEDPATSVAGQFMILCMRSIRFYTFVAFVTFLVSCTLNTAVNFVDGSIVGRYVLGNAFESSVLFPFRFKDHHY